MMIIKYYTNIYEKWLWRKYNFKRNVKKNNIDIIN